MTRSPRTRSRSGPAWLLLIAATCWILGAFFAFLWIASYIVGDPTSETAGDASLVLIITSPLYLVALAGIVVLFVGRGSERVTRPALGWSVVALGVGLLVSGGPLSVAWIALTTGGLQLTPGADWIATYPQGGATYYVYGQDLLPLWFAFWGFAAVAAAVWDRRVEQRPLPGAGKQP